MAVTYHQLYLDARRALSAMGIESAQLEAREILCAAAGKTREELLRDLTLYTGDDTAERVTAMLARREAGEPVAYIVGEWSFCGLDFFVGSEVLIPRIDTEMLAQLAISHLEKETEHPRVLDLCTGSGCIGITVAHTIKTARAVLVDLSDGALELCRRNIRRHRLSGRVVQVKGDARLSPSPALGQFDLLVCNPPYIPSGDIPDLDRSVRDYEPHMALDGGTDGLDFYRTIVEKWSEVLKPGGHLLFEVGVGQAENVARLLSESEYENILITMDTGGIKRVVEGRKKQKHKETGNEDIGVNQEE